jgi:Trypsin-like peptidase domain
MSVFRQYAFQEPAMIGLLILIMLGASPASATEGIKPTPACDAATQFNDPKFQPILDRLKGTVSMSGKFVCSAALVTLKGRSSSAPALVLSAGHCSDRGTLQIPLRNNSIAAPDVGEVLYRLNDKRPLTLDTGNSSAPRTCIETDEIVYGTLTGSDILLLRLTETYEQIETRAGVRPFLISDNISIPSGTPVRSPSSLFQDDRECVVEETVEKLKEHRWLWGPVMRLGLTCDLPHGQSGGPVLRLDSNEVIGVMGTASDGNAAPCELNNPCLVKADGTFSPAVKDQGYAHFVHQLYTCLDSKRNISLDVPGCLLPKPKRP